jgi:hypothetical protein
VRAPRRRHQNPRLAVEHDLGNAADGGGDHDLGHRHRLDQYAAEALALRRQDEHVAEGQHLRDVVAPSREVHLRLEAEPSRVGNELALELAVADEDPVHSGLRPLDSRGGVQKVPVALLGDEAPDRQCDRRRRRYPEDRAERARRRARREAHEIDAVRDDSDFPRRPGEPPRHGPRRRDDSGREHAEDVVQCGVALGDPDVPDRGAPEHPPGKPPVDHGARAVGVDQRSADPPRQLAERLDTPEDSGPGEPQRGKRDHVDGDPEIAPAGRHAPVLGNDQRRCPAAAIESAEQIHQAELTAADDVAMVRYDQDRRGATRRLTHAR